jgi:hypothetical protein
MLAKKKSSVAKNRSFSTCKVT